MSKYNNILDFDEAKDLVPAGEQLLWSEKIQNPIKTHLVLLRSLFKKPLFNRGRFLGFYLLSIIMLLIFFSMIGMTTELLVKGFFLSLFVGAYSSVNFNNEFYKTQILSVWENVFMIKHFYGLFLLILPVLFLITNTVFLIVLFIVITIYIYSYLKEIPVRFTITDKTLSIEKGIFIKKILYFDIGFLKLKELSSFSNGLHFIALESIFFSNSDYWTKEKEKIVFGPLDSPNVVMDILKINHPTHLKEFYNFLKFNKKEHWFTRKLFDKKEDEEIILKKHSKFKLSSKIDSLILSQYRILSLYRSRLIAIPYEEIEYVKQTEQNPNKLRIQLKKGYTINKTGSQQTFLYLNFDSEEQQMEFFEEIQERIK